MRHLPTNLRSYSSLSESNQMKTIHQTAFSLSFLLTFMAASPLCASVILSNLPSNDLAHGNVDDVERRAVTFTTKSSELVIAQIQLSLRHYTSLTDIALLSIHADSVTQPGNQIGSTFTAPSSTSDSSAVFTFSSTGVPLAANTTYWAVIQAGNSNAFSWNRNDPTKTPVETPYAIFGEQWIRHTAQSGWEVGDNGAHSFAIVAIPEPQPITLALTAAIFGILFSRHRCSRAKAEILCGS